MIRKSLPVLLLWMLTAATALHAQKNVKDLLRQTKAEYDAGDLMAAFESCTQILRQDQDNVEAHVYRGAILEINREYSLAAVDLNFAIQHHTRNPLAYLHQGSMLRIQKEFVKAIALFDKAIELDNAFMPAYQMRGLCHLALQQITPAMQDFRKAIALDPTSGTNQLNLGIGHLHLNDTTAAVKCLQLALEFKAPDSAIVYYYLGKHRGYQGNVTSAEQYFLKSVAIDPGRAAAWDHLYAIKFFAGDVEGALPMAEQAIRAAPNDPEGYYNKGECLLMMQRPLEAIPLYSLCIGMGGDSLSIYYLGRAQARSLVHQTIDAVKDFDKSIALDPSKPNGYALRGLNYAELGDYERALADLKKAQQLNPHSPWILLHVAGLQVTVGQIEEGTKGLLDYAAMEPTDPMVWLKLGTVSQREKQYAKAIDYLTKSIELGITDSIQAFGSRAECYAKTGRLADADTDMKLMLTIKTDDPKQLSTIGYYLNLHGKYEDALAICDSSIAMDSTFAFAYNNRGFAKYKLGMYESAIQDFDKSIALKNVYYHWPPHNRGNCLRALGRYQEAIADYNLSLSYQPDYVEALTDRGETWEKLGEPEKAIADYRLAVQYQADYKPAVEGLKRLGE